MDSSALFNNKGGWRGWNSHYGSQRDGECAHAYGTIDTYRIIQERATQSLRI